jgi:hypothetical protein
VIKLRNEIVFVRFRVLVCALLIAQAGLSAQPVPSKVHPLHRSLDELLDVYVRDGFVYYNALRIERGKLDQYVGSLNGTGATALANGSPGEQKAFWINAYNALVLRTVIDNFPIRGRAKEYPAASIRQLPGAFEKASHRVAGRMVSLDGIEKDILVPLGDARALLALGRGSYGGGRLRSEAFDAATIEKQLADVLAETVTRPELVRIDALANVLSVSPLFSWREASFAQSFGQKAGALFKERSPIERAVLAIIEPHLFGAEADFLERNAFKMQFHAFDWRLNDLGARTP